MKCKDAGLCVLCMTGSVDMILKRKTEKKRMRRKESNSTKSSRDLTSFLYLSIEPTSSWSRQVMLDNGEDQEDSSADILSHPLYPPTHLFSVSACQLRTLCLSSYVWICVCVCVYVPVCLCACVPLLPYTLCPVPE